MLGNMSVLCAIVRNETLCVVCDTKSESMPLTERRAKPRQSQEIGPRFDFTATYSRSTIRLATDRTRRQAHASPMHKWLGNVDLPEPHGTEWRRVMREGRHPNHVCGMWRTIGCRIHLVISLCHSKPGRRETTLLIKPHSYSPHRVTIRNYSL